MQVEMMLSGNDTGNLNGWLYLCPVNKLSLISSPQAAALPALRSFSGESLSPHGGAVATPSETPNDSGLNPELKLRIEFVEVTLTAEFISIIRDFKSPS